MHKLSIGNSEIKTSPILRVKKYIINVAKFFTRPSSVFSIFLCFLTYLLSVQNTKEIIRNEFNGVSQSSEINSNQSNAQTINNNLSLPPNLFGSSEKTKDNVNMEMDKWQKSSKANINDDSFLCPAGNLNFKSWAIWTKRKFKADEDFYVTFSLSDRTNNKKPPTIFFAYGDKTANKPIEYYRFNILDGDAKTVRLYEHDQRSGTEWLEEPVDITKYVTFKVSPGFSNRASSISALNPTLTYIQDGIEFTPRFVEDFTVEFPSSYNKLDDGYQYGMGISENDCFKIISSSDTN